MARSPDGWGRPRIRCRPCACWEEEGGLAKWGLGTGCRRAPRTRGEDGGRVEGGVGRDGLCAVRTEGEDDGVDEVHLVKNWSKNWSNGGQAAVKRR